MIQFLPHTHVEQAYKTCFKGILIGALFLSAHLCMFTNAYGQPANAELRILVREDNNAVHIYHTALPAIGHGFNIYRKRVSDEAFEQINIDPIRGVTSGTELRAYLGTLYDDIEQNTLQNSANGTFTKLRSDIRTANLLSFVYPKVAEALGRLYVDPSPPVGEPVTYNVEFVDALDNPTGLSIEQTLILLPQKPEAPIHLRAESQDHKITLFWQYPLIKDDIDDKVIQFAVYRIDPATNEHQQVNKKVILKNNAIFEYAYSFDVPDDGQTEQLYVRALDISGQQSEASEILRFEAIDSEPPNVVIEVHTTPLSNQRVEVTWEASETEDIRGYNLYRSSSLNDKASYTRLNGALLSPVETMFNDTLVTDSAADVYYYRVTALDASGNESAFSAAALALIEDDAAPTGPEDLQLQFVNDGTVPPHMGVPCRARRFQVIYYSALPRSPWRTRIAFKGQFNRPDRTRICRQRDRWPRV